MTLIVEALAALALLALLWSLFRLAMGLRFAKVSRERARRAEEARGRRVVAEIPLPGGDLAFFVEDERGFYWAGKQARKSAIRGARLLLNGGVMGSFARRGTALPDPPPPEEYEGGERWDVILYLADGITLPVPCGTLREGVSRDAAARVFAAAREAVGAEPAARPAAGGAA